MKFRKKPVIIEAIQLPPKGNITDAQANEVVEFLRDAAWFQDWNVGGLNIRTLEGVMHADPCDWIIKGVKGEFYPCKPDIFAMTYEPAGETE